MLIEKFIILHFISIIFLLCFLITNFIKLSNSIFRIIYSILYIIILFFVFLGRDYETVTIDLRNYMGYYNSTISIYDVFYGLSSWKADYLFFLIMPYLHKFGVMAKDYISIQTAFSLGILFYGVYNFFEKKSYAILTIFLMVCSSSFYLTQGNVLRQGFVSSIFIYGLSSNINFKYYKLISFFIHKGSMFSYLSFLNSKNVRIRMLLIIISVFLGVFMIDILLNYTPLPIFIEDKLRHYTTFERSSKNSLIKLILLIIFNIIFFAIKINSKKYFNLYSLFFTFSISSFFMYSFDGIFSRLILYTDILIPFFLVLIYNIINFKLKFIYLFFLIFLALIYSIYVFSHNSIITNIGLYFNI